MNEYQHELQKEKYTKTAQYYFAMFLKGVMYIVTAVIKILVQVVKGVLRTFGLPIPQ